jgi:hypothetical protein
VRPAPPPGLDDAGEHEGASGDPGTAGGGQPRVGARAWRCADLGGLDLLRASVSEFAFRPHAHEEFFLALTETGAAAPVYRRGRHAIGPGDLIVLNPEEAHAGGASGRRFKTARQDRQAASEFAAMAASSPRLTPRPEASAR